MTAELILALAAQGMRIYADLAERGSRGEVTDEEVEKFANALDLDLDGLRAEIDASRTAAGG